MPSKYHPNLPAFYGYWLKITHIDTHTHSEFRRFPSSGASLQYLIHQCVIHIYDDSMVNFSEDIKACASNWFVLVNIFCSSLSFISAIITLLAADIGLLFWCLFVASFSTHQNETNKREPKKKHTERNAETRILWRLFGHKSLSMHTKTEITSTTTTHNCTWNIKKAKEK